jgi:hypothetical protein
MRQLFDTFEINRVPRWPLMSRLVALSLVAHGLFLVSVVYVPSLRSLLFVAGAVSGLKFVSEDYDPTLVGQRATIVQLGPHEKLYYPPDYFGAPAVEETSPLDPMMIQPAAPPPPMPTYRPRRVRTPRAAAPEPTPEVAEAEPSPSPAAGPTPDEAQKQGEAELDKLAAESGIKRPPAINTKPFEDIAREGKKLFDDGKLNLNSAIEVTAVAALNPDGTLVEPVQLNWVTASDESTAALARQLITALSQSKLLAILDGAKEVGLALKLDQQNVSIRITSELPTDEDAGKYATGYGMLLALARNSKKGTNEGELYKNLKVTNDGKQFVLTFEMPKDAAGKMIGEMLAKRDAAAQNKS